MREYENSLNILFIAAEADPFVKIGGLGDVAGSLPKAIAQLSGNPQVSCRLDIRLAIPYYDQIKDKKIPAHFVTSISVVSTQGPVIADVYQTQSNGVITYLISGEPINRNPAIYGSDLVSDAEKFVFFSLACLALPKAIKWPVDILHGNDWHTATALHAYKIMKKCFELRNARSVLTVHNLPYMGAGAEKGLEKYMIPPSDSKTLPEWGKTLPLPMGLAAADRIVAVSPQYGREILTPEYGCDLQSFLRKRRSRISGILNGLDLSNWDPITDECIHSNFNITKLKLKSVNKIDLQREFDLEENKDIPLLVMIGRMDPQKGIDITLEGLKMIKDLPWQAILLGTGLPRLETACVELSQAFPNKVRAAIKFDSKLSRRMYAGADILLMPSRYEPCGLAQMIAMRYGCIPVARATGGLVDTIIDESNGEGATGFLFSTAEPVSFSRALQRAITVFDSKQRWMRMMKNAMKQDFSWTRSALKYIDLYSELSPKTKQKRG